MNLSLASSLLVALLSSNCITTINALESNPEESPQILSDTTTICSDANGRSSACEVELDVPAGCITSGSSDCPIVFFFHGAGGTNNWFARTSGVHAANVIGVYPQGEDGWNTGPKSSNTCNWDDFACTSDPDEGAFIASIIAELRALGANGNIYLNGNSNGAALSMRLAANAGDNDLPIKGIITKVTQLLAAPTRSGPGELNYNQPPASGGRKLSVLNIMGTADLVIPYEGGSSSVFGGDTSFQLMPALDSMATWAAHNGCAAASSSSPVITEGVNYGNDNDPNGQATFYEYQGCPEGVIVEHYALHGAGHSFGSGAALDGVMIDYDLAYQFINRVEQGAGGGGGGGGGGTQAPSPTIITPSPTASSNSGCEDDPTWHGKFNAAHTCAYVGEDPQQRCGWESTDGTVALEACKEACGECGSVETPSPTSSPTVAVTTLAPTPAPSPSPVQSATPDPTSSSPTVSSNSGCEDDPTWHGKFNVAHTCAYVGEAPQQRCGWESTDGTVASEACKEACDECDTIEAPSDQPTRSPTNVPSKSPTKTPSIQPTRSLTNEPSTAAPVSAAPTTSDTPAPNHTPVEFTSEWISSYAENAEETLVHHEISSIMNYQPSMPMPDDALDPLTACPHLEAGLLDWNDPNLSWPMGGGSTGPPPADGIEITLPADTSIIIRAGQLTSTSESPYGRITIPSGSRLIFDDTDDESIIDMHTLGITVEGSLEAGSPTCRISGGVKVTLHGEYGNLESVSDRHLSDVAASDMGLKGILVKDVQGARIDLHGKLYHPTWTRLAASVPGNSQVATSAPAVRNSEIFLQDCVNWPDLGKIIVTTSHVKDTRGYHYNEEAIIAPSGVQCVTVDGKKYGKVTLISPLENYHHAGEKEYQCEVGLLSRNILIQGNDRSDPTDVFPLECDSSVSGWTKMPCPNTFLTGFGGHTIVIGQAEGRLRGVEFHRMGMTNIMGRYPVHFHHHVPEAGSVSEVTDCSVHRSYFRAITIHDAFNLKVQRNTAFDISGHAYYLESGVEENNRVEFNLAAFVHVIDGAQLMPSNVVGNKLQSDTILVPADHTASGFYISNVHNYVIGNAASGGWSGIQFPVLPEPADKTLRFNGVVPKDRPSLLISGNSIHSSSWFAKNSGAMYEGGSLYWDETDLNSDTLIYNAGRVSSSRLTRYTKDENGNDDWFRVYNTTVWLANIGATGWGKRAEMNGFEVSDFQNRAIFVLFTVWMNSIVINCRTSNAPRVPDPGSGSNEGLLNDGRKWSGFFTYDHLMKHILTNWRVSNCGGVARGLAPWVEGGAEDTGSSGMVTIPVNGLAPEVQLISSGMTYDWETVGGQDFVKESIFFAGSGSDKIYSMQYQSNWEDADGSWTNRKVGSGISTIMAPAVAGKWWHLDYRPGKCEVRSGWKFPQQLCDKDDRKLASMFTVVMPQINTQGSAVLAMLDPNANARQTRQGSMTHFGLLGDSSLTACTPPEPCGNTTSRSWDPDLTGPYNHAQYGGWYLSFDEGTPVHLSIQKVQLEEGATMVQAMSLPPGTLANDVHIWAESRSRGYDFVLAGSLEEVRNADNGDRYYLNENTNTLYWRVIAGYVKGDLSFSWVDREAQGLLPFSRGGLTIHDYDGKDGFQIHIEIACQTDSTGAFCATAPEFFVPDMGCPDGEVMVAIDQCGASCELLEDGCSTPPPSPACVPCGDEPTPWMITQNYECATAPNWLIKRNCNLDPIWVANSFCEMRCQAAGFGYHANDCCSSSI